MTCPDPRLASRSPPEHPISHSRNYVAPSRSSTRRCKPPRFSIALSFFRSTPSNRRASSRSSRLPATGPDAPRASPDRAQPTRASVVRSPEPADASHLAQRAQSSSVASSPSSSPRSRSTFRQRDRDVAHIEEEGDNVGALDRHIGHRYGCFGGERDAGLGTGHVIARVAQSSAGVGIDRQPNLERVAGMRTYVSAERPLVCASNAHRAEEGARWPRTRH